MRPNPNAFIKADDQPDTRSPWDKKVIKMNDVPTASKPWVPKVFPGKPR